MRKTGDLTQCCTKKSTRSGQPETSLENVRTMPIEFSKDTFIPRILHPAESSMICEGNKNIFEKQEIFLNL